MEAEVVLRLDGASAAWVEAALHFLAMSIETQEANVGGPAWATSLAEVRAAHVAVMRQLQAHPAAGQHYWRAA